MGSTFPGEQETFSGVSGRPRRPADTHNQGPTRQWLREYGRRRPSRDIRDPNHGRDGARAGPAFCSHFAPTNTPKYDETGTRTKHQQKTLNHLPLNAFPPRSEGYRTWPCCTHNPKVVGSNPTPATNEIRGLRSMAVALWVFTPTCSSATRFSPRRCTNCNCRIGSQADAGACRCFDRRQGRG